MPSEEVVPSTEAVTEKSNVLDEMAGGVTAPGTTQTEASLPPFPPNDKEVLTSCACNKTKCLKLYCDCFSSGSYCGDRCECNDCYNNVIHEEERVVAIKGVLDRKPDAYNDTIKEQVGWVPSVKTPSSGKKRGRPKGSLNKNRSISLEPDVKKPRGRPRKDGNPPIQNLTPPPEPIAYEVEEYPELSMDPDQDYSHLATSFTRPLFPPSDASTSKPLRIAYSHQEVASHARSVAQSKKNTVLLEYQRIREKYLEKKLELSLADDEVEKCNQEAGMWTKKVFDLELAEPCEWNAKLEKLRMYKDEHDKLPPKNISRCQDGDEKVLALWLEKMRGNKVKEEATDNAPTSPKKQPKIDLSDFPHRIEALKALNVHFKEKTNNKFEIMFQKLIDYKEEHGTLRFPSDEQCAASGDEEFIALQKWVKSQVLNFRYSKKKIDPAIIKRFIDIGFSFERWYAKPGKKKSDIKFDEIARSAAAEADNQDQKLPADAADAVGQDTQEEIVDQSFEDDSNLMEDAGNDESNDDYAQVDMEQV